MPPRSISDHVQSLIGRTVAESKVAGASSSDVEARAILESIALNLLLKPRAVLYLAHLARNGLQNIVTQELAAIDTLSKTVDDTANTTFAPTSSLHLDSARTALVQMEGLEKVDSKSNDFQRFSSSVDDFLNKTLSRSVRQIGSTDLTRPDTEAAMDLPTDFSSLLDLHTELNNRLFALSVGIENFTSSPLGTILGLSTAYRARLDIEDIIDIINSGDSGTQARDIAIRVIGDKAALKSIGSLPVLSALLIDTVNSFPAGYSLKARSDPATASSTSGVAPFTFAASATASVTVNGSNLAVTHFPQSVVHLDNRAFLVTTDGISFPITVPTATYLFLKFRRPTAALGYVVEPNGTYLKQVRIGFPAGPRTFSQVLTDLNTGLGGEATAYEYITAGTGRIIIIGSSSSITSIEVAPFHTEPSLSTVGAVNTFSNSANDLLGFLMNDLGLSGSTPIGIIVDALNLFFSSLITASATSDQKILVETLADTPGTSLTVLLPLAMGANGTFNAQSNVLKLYGTVLGVAPDPIPGDTPTPVDPTPLLDLGDSFTAPTGSSVVQAVTTTRITLQDALNTFDGDVTAESALVQDIEALDAAVQLFIISWLQTSYASGLVTLDRAIAALSGKVTPATRNAVQAVLTDLKTNVQSLASALLVGPVPSTTGTEEQTLVTGIINTLTERKYDKALDLLLQLQVQEFFEMTGDTASYGGALMNSMAVIAQTDIKFPNLQTDENTGFKGLIKEPEA